MIKQEEGKEEQTSPEELKSRAETYGYVSIGVIFTIIILFTLIKIWTQTHQ